MRLHMLGLPHTQTTSEFSHCAFTGKVRRWGMMMAPLGYECLHYGVGAPDSSGWSECISIMTPEEQAGLLGYDPRPSASGPEFVGRDANIGHPLYVEFNRRLKAALEERLQPDDIICAPFGLGHQAALTDHLDQTIETGIGYPDAMCGFRVYESTAWLHRYLEKEHRWPWDSEWVVPNYFDPQEWPLRQAAAGKGEFVLYLGRLGALKGLNEIVGIADVMPDVDFVLCGQGDPKPWLTLPNIHYAPPVHGMDRARMFHRAACVVMPSRFVEPFGGVAVEAMLTGTPVIAPDHSAFRDTVPDALRCHTRSEWVHAIRHAGQLSKQFLRTRALGKYSLKAVGPMYDRIFQQSIPMRTQGWYA